MINRGVNMLDTQSCLSRSEENIIDLEKWQQTVNLLAELFDSRCGTVVQLRENAFNVVVASDNDDNFLQRNNSWTWEMKSFCRAIVETQTPLYINDALNHENWKDALPVTEGPVRSYCGLPIFWPNGEVFGTICVIDTAKTQYSELLQRVLVQFSQLIMADLHLLDDYNALKNLALNDELTQVNNRRGFMLLAEQKMKESLQSPHQIGIIYIDINNLKVANDQFGHAVGDRCITTLADVLKAHCRGADIIARLGGDEFVLLSLVQETSILHLLAKRIVMQYAALVSHDPGMKVTGLSYGVAIQDHQQTLDGLIEEADQAMYQHKSSNKQPIIES